MAPAYIAILFLVGLALGLVLMVRIDVPRAEDSAERSVAEGDPSTGKPIRRL